MPSPTPALTVAPVAAKKSNLLRAGLKALGSVRDDVVQHQSRVFDALLGIDPAKGLSGHIAARSAKTAAKKSGSSVAESLGLHKFEAVFDQRVAHAMKRLGLPAIEDFQALSREVEQLRAEVRSLKAAPRKR